MKKLILTFAHLLILTSLFAQPLTQNTIWSLPPNYIEHTQFGPVSQPLPAPGLTAQYGHTAMQDKDGNLAFFIVDSDLYDKNGANIVSLTSGLRTIGQEILIVPDPNDCDRYYIFYGAEASGSNKADPYYLIYEPNQSGLFQGPFLVQQLQPALPINWFDETKGIGSVVMAASQLNNNNERFVYMQLRSNIIVLKVGTTLQTVNTFPITVGNFPIGVGFFASASKGEMELVKLNNSTSRLAHSFRVFFNDNINPIQTFSMVTYTDIDNNTGLQIPNSFNTFTYPEDNNFPNSNKNWIHGLELSPNGEYIYITHTKTTTAPSSIDVYQIGVSTVPTPLAGIPTNEADDFQNSQIELGKDGELYFATNNRLATFSNPNNPTLGIWNNTKLPLNNYQAIFPSIPVSKTYILPDQIDGMNYNDHFINTSVTCCKNNSFYEVSGDENNNEFSIIATWDGNAANNPWNITNPNTVKIKDQLIIKSGANITINNMTFEFAPEAQLIIENGAKLTINNTILTVDDRCDNAVMWHGVEVWGVGSGSFQPATSGEFIANNSLIEHAVEATANYRHNLSNGNPITGVMVANTTGGILKLTNTTLKNNKLDVNMLKYQSMISNIPINDRSIFKNCDFVTDALLKDPTQLPLDAHIELVSVNGIRFLGCDFRNIASPTDYAYMARGNGILAQETKLSVEAFCTTFGSPCPTTNLDKSTFTNLVLGIRATSANPLNTARITNSEFFDVWKSISLSGLDAANVSDNIFDIGMNNGFSTGLNVSYGLALVGCDGYKVENNDFHTSFNGYLGAVSVNSGVGANEIYRNTFTDLTIGSQAMLINGDGQALTSATGLEFRCNEYENTSDFDILISSGVIKAFHGSCTNNLSPSNNQFSYTAQLGDFWGDDNLSININYIFSEHNPSLFNLTPRDGFYNQTANPHFTTIFECSVANTNLTQLFDPLVACPKRVTRTRTQLANLRESLKVIIDDLNNQIDNGNTQSLLNLIATSSGGTLKDSLLSVSPYLSDEVLVAYILSSPSAGNLKQILIANSPLSNKVLSVLEKEILPKGVKNQIDNVQVGISPRQELEGEIAYYEAELRKAEFDIIRLLLFDFSDDNKENVKDVVDFLKEDEINNTNNQNQMLVNAYMANNDFNNAQQKLMQIHADTVNADFCKLKSTVIACQQFSEKEMALLTQPNLQQNVNEVATATSTMQEVTSAQMLLEQVGLSLASLVDVEMVIPSN